MPRHRAVRDGRVVEDERAWAWRRISRIARVREWWPDCWTRVLRRSMGWRRTAERRPEKRPAVKWKTGWCAVC